jgi:plastocyanin
MSRTNVLFAALLLAAGLGRATQVPVSIIDFAFQPDTVRVRPGDSVIWTNNGAFLHTSTSGVNGVPDGLWNSGDMAHGVTFVHGFPTDGRFNYYCAHHYLSGMKGVVVVGTSGVSESPGLNLTGITSFPNPIHNYATIRFAALTPGPVDIVVVDVAGRRVRRLVAARQRGRTHEVSWDTRDDSGDPIPAGVYLVKLESGAYRATQKLVVQR